MKSTHTPGPWKATGKEVGTDYEATHGMVASIIGMPNRWETEANARLIAAAPDLYAAVEALLALHADDGTRDDVPEWKAARAALAKARGE